MKIENYEPIFYGLFLDCVNVSEFDLKINYVMEPLIFHLIIKLEHRISSLSFIMLRIRMHSLEFINHNSQWLNAHFVVTVLSKLVTSLKETESLSSEQELSFLQSLLESREINALVNVHSKVGKVCKDEKCAPLMSSSIQASLMTIVF